MEIRHSENMKERTLYALADEGHIIIRKTNEAKAA
jgi:hypothetical protein